MIAILRAILALLASLGLQPEPQAPQQQPIIITPDGPPRFCPPDQPRCE